MSTATRLDQRVVLDNDADLSRQRIEGTASRIIRAVRQWISDLSLDERERYLSAAGDHDDLAKRMRAWDEQEQRRLWTLLP